MSYEIKHMGIGGVLDQGIAIVRDNFVLLFTITLFAFLPLVLIQSSLQAAAVPDLPPNPTFEEMMRANQEVGYLFPLIGALGLLNFCIVIPFTNAAVIQAVARLYLGQPITALEAVKHALRRIAPLIGTSILMYLAIWAGLVMCLVPGIYFAIWFGLSQHVVVIEGIAGPAALRRSKHLVHKDRGKFLALAIILFVITIALTMASNYIPQSIVRVVVASLVQAVTAMLWAAVFVVFYFSCRCGVENFDLHYLAESINTESADAGSDPAIGNLP
jgi:hypothetical protein